MKKLEMQTDNIVSENVEKIATLFPNAVTEAGGKKVIDFDILRQELMDDIVEGREERYEFSWPDKRKSILTANTPISKMLRPCIEESKDFENTENLYIEGDNLDVLKLLRETYLNSIKMIYIDPPYNTGKDFVYNDNFTMSKDDYDDISGEHDEDGNRLEENTKSNGRFHTDWLNMMYPRLKLARDLLSDDGVIFISIDDNEVHNLRKICDEIFGVDNFVACFIWKKKGTSTNVKNSLVSSQTDYQLCYSKMLSINSLNKKTTFSSERIYPYSDATGKYRLSIIEKKDSGNYARSTMKFCILGIPPRDGKRWQIGLEKAKYYESRNLLINDNGIIKLKTYESDDKNTYSANPNLLLDYGSSDNANKEVNVALFKQEELFSNPKPVSLLLHLIKLATDSSSTVLDFFSGSATTAHAVMQLNAEDGGNRKFIMVQLPEKCDEKSEAYKAGYKNICEIGKERIRRAGEKIKNQTLTTENTENLKNLDIGFRVLKLDSTNMNDVYYYPDKFTQANIEEFIDNVKSDRSPRDLLFQIMLELGVNLSAKISHEIINTKTVYTVNYAGANYIKAVFDDNVPESVVTEIAKTKPYHAVIKSTSISNDSMAVNFEQIFKLYSPETNVRVL